ncbi:alpha/beta hydrolase [Kozakia baliensis]|uniref:Signal peptide-containing protein n=1 Tax=Kozakia baliensis TaxID=153496 RepID=A0A1D8UZ38_9PROT|nr:lipase family protein [Kozakia baliensis]AOX18905.1 signal peptide-containing protein [Kozakia baliensis]GEL65404.1 lipase [Kozakia baliensis]
MTFRYSSPAIAGLTAALCIATAPFSAHAGTPSAQPQPGSITSVEALNPAFSLPDAGRALKITYLSTNGVTDKGLVPVTAEVILPAGTPPAGGWPIVAWAHGTVGVADHCAPSNNPWTDRNRRYLSEWMKRGFAVVGTDYQGLGTSGTHAYLDTRVEAYSLLDAVRAALGNVPGLQNKIMIVGQSQGGGAAFASAAFSSTYAPELGIRGTVATGAPYITPELMQQMIAAPASGHTEAAYNPVMVYTLYLARGQAVYDPTFRPEDAFTPKAMSAYQAGANLCVYELTDKVKQDGLNFGNSLKPGYSKALAPALAAMKYPTLKLSQPLFMGTGELDRDVPPALQHGLVKAACAAGTTVQAHVYKGLNHDQTVNTSLADSTAFTKAVMDGQPVTPECNPTPE